MGLFHLFEEVVNNAPYIFNTFYM